MTRSNSPAHPSAPLALWLVAGLSLALNIVILGVIVAGLMAARTYAGEAANQLENASRAALTTTVRISQTVPIRAQVPINQSLEVPINQNLPIDTVVQVQREVPVLGVLNFDLPIKTNIPVNLKAPVTINTSITVDTVVPVRADVPVTVSLAGTPLGDQLASLARMLRKLAGQ